MSKSSSKVGIELDITSANYVYIDWDPFDKEVLEDVKDIPGREFVDTQSRPKQWKFKLNKATMSPFLQLCSDWDIDIPTSIKNRMEEIVEEAKKWEKRKEENERILDREEPELDRVYGTAKGMQLYPFQRKAVEYVENNRKVIIGDEMGLGKAQPLDEPVLTPSGWKAMGEMEEGDEVVGSDGEPVKVTGTYSQGEKDIYEIEFTDGATVRACGEHLWAVRTPTQRHRDKPAKIKSTEELVGDLRHDSGYKKWFIPVLSEPVQYNANHNYYVSPYALGLLLGDGTMNEHYVNFATDDPELVEGLREGLPSSVKVKNRDAEYRYSITEGKRYEENTVHTELKQLDVCHRAENKHVPDKYKYGPAEARIAIMQGLLDTDGSTAQSAATFSSASRQLAEDLQEIVRSLGGTCSLRTSRTTYTASNGETKEGQNRHRLHIRLPDNIKPFRLQRKLDALNEPHSAKTPTRSIERIEHVGREEAKCISVDAEDSLYATSDHVLTHNTVEAIGAIQHMDAYPALIVCPSTLKYNWKKEWETWLPRRAAKVQEAGEGLDLRGSVSIINYAVLWRYREKLREKNWNSLVLDESHYCLPYDEKVITDEGVAPIGDVVEEGVGEGVMSYDHASGEVRFQAITERMSREYEGNLIEIEHEHGSVTATPEHPFMTRSGWSKASDLSSEDNLMFVSGKHKAPVQNVREVDYGALNVYNIGVRRTQCYFAGGVLAHNCKNGSAKRSKAAKQIARRMPEDALKLLLTGTAVVNRPKELINQLKIVDVFEREFGNFYNYTSRFCEGHQGRWGWDASGASNLGELHDRLRRTCYIRREKEDVLEELPEKTRSYTEFEIDNRREYDAAEEDIVAYMKAEAGKNEGLLDDDEDVDERLREIEQNRSGPNNDMAENLVKIMKLKQLAVKGKFGPAKRWIRDFLKNESPLVVFAWHTDVVEGIADEFDAPFITGDTPSKRRHEIVEEFQNGEHDLLSLNMHAAGEGITLTEASNAVFLELPWTWGTVSQCEARVHRIGTEDAVNIYFHLGQDTIDRDIFDLLKKKRVVTEKVNKGRDITDESGNIVQGVIEKLKQK